MKLKIRIDCSTQRHTIMTLFMDGANCGHLTMLVDEATVFINTLRKGLQLEVENESKLSSNGNSTG